MITMRQLEILCAVIDSGSVTKASERLYLSQPAVSKIIASLEHQARLTLFRREHRRLVPTAEAIQLYEGAQRLLKGITDIARLAEELHSLNSGSLVVASFFALGHEVMPAILSRFLAVRPNVNLAYQVRSSNKIMQWAIAQQIDLGISMTAMEHEAVEIEKLCQVDAVCVFAPTHKLTGRAWISAEDLEGERFISFGREGRMGETIDQVFESKGVRRVIAATTYNSHSACSLALQSIGVALVDPFSAKCFVPNGLVVKPFRPAIRYDFQLLWPRFRERNRLVETFVPLLKKEVRRYIALMTPRPLRDTVDELLAIDEKG